MTTLELFKKHRKGEVSRERFLYEVRRDNNLPWVTNNTSYDDAVKILKNKGIIREAQFEPQNIATDPVVDRVNPYALKREVQKLLAKEKVLTNDSYKEALNKAARKLTTPQEVKNAMFANAETVEKADAKLQTQEVKKANHVDKHNGMKKMKGQQAPKATSAPTKENRKTKKPKGVEIMKDKGVEGSEKIIKESLISELTSYLKKNLNLAENSPYHDHSVGQKVPTPHGEGIIKEINAGTLCVEVGGKLYDVQMNVVQKLKEKEKEEPQHQYESGFNQLEEATFNTREEAEEYARKESENGYVQHVQDKGGHFTVDDWYDSDETVVSYENGNLLENEFGSGKLKEEEDDETPLEIGDIVLVTYPNQYQGEKGEVVELSRDGSFLTLEMPDGNTVSMHSSDVELTNDDFEDDDEELYEATPFEQNPFDKTVDEILDTIQGSQILDDRFKELAAKVLDSILELVQAGSFERALFMLKKLQKSIEDRHMNSRSDSQEYAVNYKSYFETLENFLNAELGSDEDLEEAGEKTAIVTTTSGEKTAVDYKTDDELKSIGDNADVRALKTGTGRKVKE